MDWWREIRNATADYLALKKTATIVETKINDDDDATFIKMIKWCEKPKNVQGSWGPGRVKEYDGAITFRFWRHKESEKFAKRFKKYIKGSEQIVLK